ncbi:8-oxo-dGTP diphosphatase MutT [Pseudoalteromonas sp. MMG010]|uniref:8-oxo-dGTP diphosphatase MutT n=1 Tax=Pseudoalteromonas sp. MMG010 TaxID=2822685 RepID=UPI001B39DC9A|nr:8-oxo-dGTP diphosphatase MutT [Pseudoalteromonas sp. MMG010]MBQ4832606.1 8-oxo-dGTP diphosphatase MutT [Pseudoalteromonas sp. MMG010]
MSKKVVRVAVGVIKKDNQIFICKRNENQHQGGLWEFPGGKVESDETLFEALYRELKEEIGLSINSSSELMVIEHDYGDKYVKLEVHLVNDFKGIAHGAEGQEHAWVAIQELKNYTFPAANKAIIKAIETLSVDGVNN